MDYAAGLAGNIILVWRLLIICFVLLLLLLPLLIAVAVEPTRGTVAGAKVFVVGYGIYGALWFFLSPLFH